MDEETSIHWHGILVPPEMDGVPYQFFSHSRRRDLTYEFPILRAAPTGTTHTMLQQQIGVYGAIVIELMESRVMRTVTM
jgi:FtsP/CotA-like multicopper oxidase with cupredoxin domain